MMIRPEIQLRLARDRAEELRREAASYRASSGALAPPSRRLDGSKASRGRVLRALLALWRSVQPGLLGSDPPKENLMSPSQDWTAHTGEGPARYQRLLVPAAFDPFARMLVAHARVSSGMRILDLACGTGAVSRVAARAAGRDGEIVAVDISAPMLAVAGACPPDAGAAPITYIEGRAESPPVEDQTFDLVLCQQGVQFFADRAAAFAAMRRALRDGGRLAIATWTDLPTATPFAALADALERHVGADVGTRMRQPWSLSDREQLRALASEAGFVDVEVSTHTSTARFARRNFARELVLATPLAHEFQGAPVRAQKAIVADVTAAISACDGDDDEFRHPLSANFLTAVAPGRVPRTDPGASRGQTEREAIRGSR